MLCSLNHIFCMRWVDNWMFMINYDVIILYYIIILLSPANPICQCLEKDYRNICWNTITNYNTKRMQKKLFSINFCSLPDFTKIAR